MSLCEYLPWNRHCACWHNNTSHVTRARPSVSLALYVHVRVLIQGMIPVQNKYEWHKETIWESTHNITIIHLKNQLLIILRHDCIIIIVLQQYWGVLYCCWVRSYSISGQLLIGWSDNYVEPQHQVVLHWVVFPQSFLAMGSNYHLQCLLDLRCLELSLVVLLVRSIRAGLPKWSGLLGTLPLVMACFPLAFEWVIVVDILIGFKACLHKTNWSSQPPGSILPCQPPLSNSAWWATEAALQPPF